MRREHGLMTPEEIADQQELRQRVQERQEIATRQDAALKEYKNGPAPADHEPMVPLVAFITLCVVLVSIAVYALS